MSSSNNKTDSKEAGGDGWYSIEAASADSRAQEESSSNFFKRNMTNFSSSSSSNFRSAKPTQVAVKSVEDLQRDYFWDSVEIHFDPALFVFQLMVQIFPYPFILLGWINPITQGKQKFHIFAIVTPSISRNSLHLEVYAFTYLPISTHATKLFGYHAMLNFLLLAFVYNDLCLRLTRFHYFIDRLCTQFQFATCWPLPHFIL